VLFPNVVPSTGQADIDFRAFLQKVLAIYFQGSIPKSMASVAALFANGATVVVHENFLESRNKASGLDISDQFGFAIDVILPSPGALDPVLSSKNTRILLDIIRPAHTLYKLKYILQDTYIGQQSTTNAAKVLDVLRGTITSYNYEDFRKFVEGVFKIDPLGSKKAVAIVGEIHSGDF
jgi:hypothetical protein